MKNYILLICTAFCILFTFSCKKYEDGPYISFKKAEPRVINKWNVSVATINGANKMADMAKYQWEFFEDKYFNISIEYTDKSYYSTSGTWSLKDNNKYLELNESGTIELFRIRELRKGKMSIEGDFDGKKYFFTFLH
ncbi:MAG: lipocalin family protein [Bacteroidota bacterium]